MKTVKTFKKVTEFQDEIPVIMTDILGWFCMIAIVWLSVNTLKYVWRDMEIAAGWIILVLCVVFYLLAWLFIVLPSKKTYYIETNEKVK